MADKVKFQGLWMGILTSAGSFARFVGPITVLISSGLLDLGSFDRSRFKIVVKDLMLMEMRRMAEEQRPVIAEPAIRRR